MTSIQQAHDSIQSPNLGSIFDQAAARYPAHEALLTTRSYSYRELAQRRDALMPRLVESLQQNPDAPVCGVLVEKGVWAYASILAVLAVGGTYVPLHPEYPVSRLRSMIERASLQTIIVDRASVGVLKSIMASALDPIRVLVVDDETAGFDEVSWHGASEVWLPSRALTGSGDKSIARRSEYAYLLFTSGTTGQPKGVAIRHESALHYVSAIAEGIGLPLDGRHSQFFDFTFDLSVHDLFVTFHAGACLVPASRAELLVPHAFINKREIAHWFSVPSLGAHAVTVAKRANASFPTLRTSLFCGEALPAALAQAWRELAPGSAIDNLYGPTEATIAIARHRCTTADCSGTVSLGKPLLGSEIVAVDEEGKACSVGEKGELFLGGLQLADGYLSDDGATLSKFVPARFSGYASTRWYRSGDVGSLDADGRLHFHGRVDRQVKLRGYRVELQEIENIIRDRLPRLVIAVTVATAPNGQANTCVAWLGGAQPEDLHAAREYCRAMLPWYMVPTDFRAVADVPRNANGKTDYAELAAMS